MTRFLAIFVAFAVLALTACGGGETDSKSEKTPSGTSAEGATNTTATPSGGSKRKRSSTEQTVLAPKPGTPQLTGQRQIAYLKAKAACDSSGIKGIVRRYGLHGRNAVLVARLYSKKAFAPAAQGAGFAGCVAGFR